MSYFLSIAFMNMSFTYFFLNGMLPILKSFSLSSVSLSKVHPACECVCVCVLCVCFVCVCFVCVCVCVCVCVLGFDTFSIV